MTGLAYSINEMKNNYNLILVIINHLIKIFHYKLITININTLGLAKVIKNVIIYYNSLLNSIIIDRSFFFISKFL